MGSCATGNLSARVVLEGVDWFEHALSDLRVRIVSCVALSNERCAIFSGETFSSRGDSSISTHLTQFTLSG